MLAVGLDDVAEVEGSVDSIMGWMTLGLASSYAVLCLVQGALVLAPLETGVRRRLPAVGLLVPVAALVLGVGLLRAFAASPRALAVLAVVATPLLAGCAGWLCGWRRPSVALVLSGSLYLLAWQLPSRGGEAAAVALIGLACLALAAAVASVAPPRSMSAGLVLLAAVDVFLVWGVGQVGPATTALARATLPAPTIPLLAHRPLPALQQATFGSASMGWLDLLAPALLCATLAPRGRLRAAVTTALAAGAWGLLLIVTSPIPATVPVLAGLLVARGAISGRSRRLFRSRTSRHGTILTVPHRESGSPTTRLLSLAFVAVACAAASAYTTASSAAKPRVAITPDTHRPECLRELRAGLPLARALVRMVAPTRTVRLASPLRQTPRLHASGYVFPLADAISLADTFGASRPGVAWHHGDDLFASKETPVRAVADGVIFSVGWQRLGGRRLWLRDTAGNEFYYAHLDRYARNTRNGERVRAGDVVAYVGNSGDAERTPPHLHFEIHPASLLGLGYDGAVDPTAYLRAWPVSGRAHLAARKARRRVAAVEQNGRRACVTR